MATAIINRSFAAGEITPSLFGHTDVVRYQTGAATMRNMIVSYRGGAYSRAGTQFVGYSRQTGRSYPPRLIPFQFSQNQGLTLEFGHQYMRVVYQGSYVTDTVLGINNVSQAKPAHVSSSSIGALTAKVNPGGITASYSPGDTVTLAGGTYSQPSVLTITDTAVISLGGGNVGQGYAPGDTIVLAGGTQVVAPAVQINSTQVAAAAVAAGGSGGTNGVSQIVQGTTGTGTYFQASVNISGGAIISVNSITLSGSYTTNPTNIAAEPVTGNGLTGATLSLQMGPLAFTITQPGDLTKDPVGGVFTQASTTGSGTGANFNSALFAPLAVSISTVGAYTAFPPNPVSQASSSGTGQGATFTLTSGLVKPLNNGDWVYLTGINGMTQLNGRTFVAQNTSTAGYDLYDVFGNPVDATGYAPYSNGGTSARLYTLTTPYSEQDLGYLKFIQSADVMSLCCINQKTQAAYPPQDLTRFSDSNWVFENITTVSPNPPVAGLSATISGSFSYYNTYYSYSVTSVAADGSESVAATTTIGPVGDINASAGSVLVKWGAVNGISVYNVYKATPGQFQKVQPGALAGYIGKVTGGNTSFLDLNFDANFVQVPPTHDNPFVDSNTYPSVVSYFQQRRVYANTLANPDTYFMSQPGSFLNFDSRTPTIDTDAIIGDPWSLQVDGIQFMVPMPGGLVVLTGNSAWQVTGAGGSNLNPVAITPQGQQAQPQAFNGCSSTLPPIKIDYDILYVQSKGSIYRDLSYNFYSNIYTGTDLTISSAHLFTGYTMVEHAYCEEPYKIVWAVRNDGVLLSMTYVKPEQIVGWARHDTNGLFKSCCTITEPPVDALYLAVQRTIAGRVAYTVERMDNRIWGSVEDTWCVDCGLRLTQPQPAANLSASSATGLGSVPSVVNLVGGTNYSAATYAVVTDNIAPGAPTGAGAVPALTIAGGVITAVTFPAAAQGSGYSFPAISFVDPTNQGSGASATCVLNNTMQFIADAPVFSAANVGSVIRMGGGVATITGYVGPMIVTAAITTPISKTQPNTPPGLIAPVIQQPAGTWTMTAPVQTVRGLFHLAGALVTGLADGNVVSPRMVAADGSVVLDAPASSITLGIWFQSQFQTVYLDSGEPTIQGQRGKVSEVTVRIEASRGLKMGANQIDGSTQFPPALAPTWNDLQIVPDKGKTPYNSTTQPLYTGDVRVPVGGGYSTRKQACLQQDNPLPMQILATIPEVLEGDVPEQSAKPRQPQQGGR